MSEEKSRLSPNDRIIVALDFDNAEAALRLVDRLGEPARIYKVGLELLTSTGPSVVRELIGRGKQVFLDLKLHEIPSSVAGAVRAAGRLGVSMVTVHASGGSAVLRAAVEAARPFPELKILALTVITSLSDRDLPEIGISGTAEEQVLRLARLAAECGCHGVIASPQEAMLLRAALPSEMLIICPGVQLAGDTATDHARRATPGEAIRSGATHVVMGRAIAGAGEAGVVWEELREG